MRGDTEYRELTFSIFETSRKPLYYSCCAQVCLERAMKRGQAGGAMARTDDNLESFKKR